MGRLAVCCWWRPSGRLVWIGCCRRNSAGWRKPFAVHDPGKIICDLAVGLALSGDCLADVAALRDEPGIYGRVASDPTVSRLIKLLASDADRAIAAIGRARKAARETDWRLAGDGAPVARATAADPLIIDLDAILVTAQSEKEKAAATFKHRFRVPPVARVRRSRPARDRGTVDHLVASR